MSRRSAAVGAALVAVLSMSCSRQSVVGNWYLVPPLENGSPDEQQNRDQLVCKHGLYVLLVNVSDDPLPLDCVHIVNRDQWLETTPLAAGEMRTLDLQQFGCQLPTEVVLYRGRNVVGSISLSEQLLASALPEDEEHVPGCRAECSKRPFVPRPRSCPSSAAP